MTGFAAYADRLGTTLAGLGGEEMFDSLVEALEHNLAEERAEGHAEGRLGAMMEMAQVLWGPGQEAALEPQPGHALYCAGLVRSAPLQPDTASYRGRQLCLA